ncbi:Vps54-domain-containing protein [Patellaria atrata CBS 101060]|uniref:Vacuolar protein sorting-associated protein 54 n=1 Tax=Patellaria atrata CBS 101060 TaxID=1346257 RepID=A0A9P4SEH0_9PEZI|nr:Vps54-domain-containing protein [Patellaria atrata CBS 101060]
MSSPSLRKSLENNESPSSNSSRNQYPFPQQPEWPPKPTAGGTWQGRRGSTASSISSIGGSLDTSFHSRPSTVTESGQNAISTLLQPPIVRTGLIPHTSVPASSAHKPPSTKDIPSVILTNIPHVELAAFRPYLTQVKSLYDAFQSAKAESDGTSSRSFGKDTKKKEEFGNILERGLRVPGTPEVPSPPDSPKPPRRRSSGGVQKKGPNAITPLSTIPEVYFEENFRLENPRTFDIVSERSEVVRPQVTSRINDDPKSLNGSAVHAQATGRKALATNAILQEKLSWYMDTVEVHLISSISTASTSFFAALGSLRELQSEAAESVQKIKALRTDLTRLDNEMAVGGLKVISMKRRRENLRKLNESTQQLRSIVDGVSHCEELLDSGDIETSIDRMDVVERLMAGNLDTFDRNNSDWLPPNLPPRLIDLRRLKVLDAVLNAIMQMKFRAGKGFESRFLEALLQDIRSHVQTVPPQETLQRWGSAAQRARGEHNRMQSTFPAYMKTNHQLRIDLKSILNGLSRSNHTGPATAAFRDAVMREIKNLIREHLPSSSEDDAESVNSVSTRGGRQLSNQDRSSILARNLRALDPETAEELYTRIYTGVGEALRRLSVQIKVLLDVTSGVTTPPPSGGLRSPPKSPNFTAMDGYLGKPLNTKPDMNLQEELLQALDMSSLLGQAVDVAHTQITKILRVRAEQTVRLPLQRFLRYFVLNRSFADECEAISGRSGAGLKGVVQNQITEYVSLFGELEKQRLLQRMESDRWEAQDFGDEEDKILSRVLQGMSSDPVAWLNSTRIWEDAQPEGLNGINGTQTNSVSKDKVVRNAIIDEEKFILVNCAIAALKGIDRLENLITGIPSMTADIASALLDYLKLFNSRSCQLILGAGATKSEAGLKNINTKHLALASQALSFMIALIPYIREFARRRLPPSSPALGEFEKVKRLYYDHQSSIHDKLVDIMSTRATAHIKVMRTKNFDVDIEEQTSPHMETLARETSTLYRVLSKHLPELAISMILGPVFASYKEQWGKAFTDASVKTEAGKARLLRDAELFDSKLSKIDGSNGIGTYIIDIVKAKSVESPPPITETQSNDPPAGVDAPQ